jgi:Protein O-mannosyl-transferase TMEM260-like
MRRDRLIAVIFAFASLALYIATSAPSVATVFDDSLEFQIVLPTLGIAHPSGYPLFTMAGKLATLLIPFRDPAGRANLLSALAAAAALGFLYLVARRFAGNRLAATLATAVFAISPAWWSQSTIAEVYAPHGLLMILFLYLLLRWEEDRRQSARADRWLSAAALFAGLGLAHHRMIALLFPAALVFILWTDPGLLHQPRRWIAPACLLVAPLLLYLYLPLRGRSVTSIDGTYQPTLQGTLDWLLARGYRVFLTGNPFNVNRGAGDFLALFLDQFGALFLISALLGVATGWRWRLRHYAFLLLATVFTVAFGVAYKVQDIAVFFIPAFILAAIWAAWGLTPILDGLVVYGASITRRLQPPGVAEKRFRLPASGFRLLSLLPAVLLAFILLLEPVQQAIQHLDGQDRSRQWSVYEYGQDMLEQVPPGGRIIGLLGETTLVRYFRDVLGQRPDIQVTPADTEAARYDAVDQALARGEPVYLTRDLPGAGARYSLDAAGPLIAVSPKAMPGPAPGGQPLGHGILLANSQTELRKTHAGPVVRLHLTWAATRPIPEELKVSARLLDPSGNVLVADDRVPVHFAYPTTAWMPGESVSDVYDLPLPADAPPGPYGLQIILYRAADGSEVGRMELPPPPMVR